MFNDEKFFFLTNRLNLLSVISGGIIGSSELYSKHKDNNLSKTFGNNIILFKGGVSQKLIEMVTEGNDRNFPILIEININNIDEKNVLFKDDKIIVTKQIFIFSESNNIYFRNNKECEDFTARKYDNVPISNYNFNINETLFNFDISFCSDDIKFEYNSIENLLDISQIADKTTGSIALLSKNMGIRPDAILLKSLIEQQIINDRTNLKEEYDCLVDFINILVSNNDINPKDSENVKLIKILLDYLFNKNPSDGWNSYSVLQYIYEEFKKYGTSESVYNWYNYCLEILENKRDIIAKTFQDDKDIAKRGIFLFLIRPEYFDIINSKDSSLKTSHNVRTFALLLSGYRVGYERLTNEFKTPKNYHEIFSLLKKYIIEKNITKDIKPLAIEIDSDSDVLDKEYLCKVSISKNLLTQAIIQVPEKVKNILSQMNNEGFTKTKYEMLENQISYSFHYSEINRKQPIYINIERYYIKISSPCVEFTKYKTYEKKYATNKVLSAAMLENGEMNGEAYFVYNKGINIALERKVAILNIDNVDLISIMKFVAKKADNFEEKYFHHDKVK